MYIVIEGQDGTGKDTQTKLLVEYLEKQGKKVHFYSESGTDSEDEFVAKIAKLNYGSHQDIDNKTRVLLYLVNRYEQWRKIAEPALSKNEIVITTRNWFSTLIYEGILGGVESEKIIALHKTLMPENYFTPDKIVFLTLSEEERAERRKAQGERTTTEVWKSKNDEFQQKLNQAYLDVAEKFEIPTLDASGTPEKVHNRLKKFFKI